MARRSLRTRAGIQCREFSGAASDSRSALDSESDSSADLDGAGDIGGTTGVAVEPSLTITSTFRTAASSVTTDSITVISVTATLVMEGSVMAVLTMAALTTVAMAMPFTAVQTFTHNLERTLARLAVDLITAEMPEAFPPVDTPALEEAASMGVRMGAAEDTK